MLRLLGVFGYPDGWALCMPLHEHGNLCDVRHNRRQRFSWPIIKKIAVQTLSGTYFLSEVTPAFMLDGD